MKRLVSIFSILFLSSFIQMNFVYSEDSNEIKLAKSNLETTQKNYQNLSDTLEKLKKERNSEITKKKVIAGSIGGVGIGSTLIAWGGGPIGFAALGILGTAGATGYALNDMSKIDVSQMIIDGLEASVESASDQVIIAQRKLERLQQEEQKKKAQEDELMSNEKLLSNFETMINENPELFQLIFSALVPKQKTTVVSNAPVAAAKPQQAKPSQKTENPEGNLLDLIPETSITIDPTAGSVKIEIGSSSSTTGGGESSTSSGGEQAK